MLEVLIAERRIHAFDSLHYEIRPSTVHQYCNVVHLMLTGLDFPIPEEVEWTFVKVENYPRQQNGRDCGIFSSMVPFWRQSPTGVPRFVSENEIKFIRLAFYLDIMSKKKPK